MDLPNMRGTKTEVKIFLRFNRSSRNSKFLTALANAQTANELGAVQLNNSINRALAASVHFVEVAVFGELCLASCFSLGEIGFGFGLHAGRVWLRCDAVGHGLAGDCGD